MRRLIVLLIPLFLFSGILVPEFIATDGHGVRKAEKTSLWASANDSGEIVAGWIDSREGGAVRLCNKLHLQLYSNTDEPERGNQIVYADFSSLYDDEYVRLLIFNDGQILTSTRTDQSSPHKYCLWDPTIGFSGNPLAHFEINFGSHQSQYQTATDGDSLCVTAAVDSFQLFYRSGEIIGERRVIDEDRRLVNTSSVIMDGEGNVVILYTYYDSQDSRHYALFRHFDKDGNSLGEPVEAPYTYARMTNGKDGDILFFWKQYVDGLYYPCYQLFDSMDTPKGEPTVFSDGCEGFGHVSIPVAVSGPDEDYLLLWNEEKNGTFTVFGQFISSSGERIGDYFSVSDTGIACTGLNLAATPEYYRVFWIERYDSEAEPNYRQEFSYEIKNRKVYPSGEMDDITYVNDDESGVFASWNESVIKPDGDFFIAWNIDGSNTKYFQDFNQYGESNSSLQTIDEMYWLSDVYFDMGLDGKLRAAYWTLEGSLGDGSYNVWLQEFDSKGNTIGDATQVGEGNSLEGHWCNKICHATGPTGKGLVLWMEPAKSHAIKQLIWGQRFRSNGERMGSLFFVDTTDHRMETSIFAFEDGGYALGYIYKLWPLKELRLRILDSEGNLENMTTIPDIPGDRYYKMECNGKDRIVVVETDHSYNNSDTVYFWLFDRGGNQLGERLSFRASGIWNNYILWDYLGDKMYENIAVAMAPEGKFVVSWYSTDETGNIDVYARLFDKDGNPLSSAFKVNDDDQYPYSCQFTSRNGVSCDDERIIFTWLENRHHRGYDVVAKVTDWNLAGVDENFYTSYNPMRLTTHLNQLSYTVAGEAQLNLYSTCGRMIISEIIEGSGTFDSRDLPQGVYFAQVRSGEFVSTAKMVVLK